MLDANLGRLPGMHLPVIGARGLGPDQLLVIFDGTCGLCSSLAFAMAPLDWRRKLAWLPSQTPGLIASVGLTADDVGAAAWVMRPDGELRRGAGAIFAALDAVLPAGIPVLSTAYRLPGLRQLADWAYAWVARNRGRFPGPAVCDFGLPAPLDDAARWEIERRRARFDLA